MNDLRFLNLLTLSKPKRKDASKTQEMVQFHTNFKRCNFGKISERDLEKIIRRIQEGNNIENEISLFVKEIKFDLTITQNCYDSLRNSQNYSIEDASFYLLHSIFSWLFFTSPQTKNDTCNIVLNSTAAIKGTIPDEEETSLYSYVINYVYSIYSDTKIEDIINSMFIFFEKPGTNDSKIFDILFQFFNRLTINDSKEIDPQTQKFLELFSQIFPKSPSFLSSNVYEVISFKLKPFLLNFDLPVYQLFHNVLPYSSVDSIYSFFVTVFNEYKAQIEANQPFFSIQKSDEQGISIQLPMNPQFKFQVTHGIELTLESTINIDDIPPIENIVNEKFDRLINSFLEVTTTKESQMVFEQHVVTLIQSKLQSEYLFDHIYSISKILLSFEQSDILIKIIDMLLQTRVFDPSITILNENLSQNEKNCISIRSIIYNLIFQNFKSCLPLFLNLFLTYPRMISELFVFMTRNIRSIPPEAIENHFVRHLQNIAMNYSTLLFDKTSSDNSLLIKQLMELFAVFLSNLFYCKDIAVRLFVSDNFITMMFSLIFQPYLRKIILETFKNVILKYRIAMPDQSILHIISIFESSKYGETEFDYLMIYDIALIINSLISERKDFVDSFLQLREILCFVLYNFKKYDISEKLFNEIINFYSIFTKIEFDLNKSLSVVHAIRILYGDEPPEHLYSLFLTLMQNDENIITQKFIPVLILLAFSNSSRNVEYLHNIFEMCRFSLKNTVTIHSGRFDVYLLELINQKKESLNESEGLYIIEGLKLLEKICGTISSTPVVKKFIGLLCPIKEKFISKYQINFLNSLIYIINQQKLSSNRALPLSKLFYVRVNDLKPNLFQKGFEVTFWLFSENSNDSANLLSIVTKEKNEINISIQHGKINFIVKSPKATTFSYTISEVKIPQYEWFYISLNMSKKNDILYINGYLNDKKLIQFNCLWNSMQFVQCEIGRNDVETSFKISSFGLFIIPNNESLYSKGPSAIHSNALFYITNEIIDETLTPKCTSSSNIAIECIGQPIQPVTFLDALIKICTVESLLPLYAQLDFPYLDKTETPPTLPITITKIFSSLLSIGKEIELEIIKSNAISIIAFLLSSLNRNDYLTYDFFSTFYQIFESTSEIKLRSQIFEKILMSFPLWSNAAAKEAERVTKDWVIIYKEFMPNSVSIFTFEHLLYLMDEYFPCTGNSHITSIRASLIEILLYISTTDKFRQKDVSALIGESIIIGRDKKPPFNKIGDLITLIQSMATSPSKPLEKFPNTDIRMDIMQMHDLFNTQNEVVISCVLNLFIVLHSTPIFNFLTIEQHMDALLPFFSPFFLFNLFNQIVAQAASCQSGFVPLTFYMAYLNPDFHEKIMTLITPRKGIISHVKYSFWLFANIYKYDNDFGNFLVQFIIDCKFISIKQMMIIIDVVGLILGKHEHSRQVKIRFLTVLIDMIPNMSNEDCNEFFEVSFQFLLFKKEGTYMNFLKDELISNYNAEFPKEVNIDFNDRMKKNMIHDYLETVKNQEFKFTFGIDMNYSSSSDKLSAKPQMNNHIFAHSLINMVVLKKQTEFYDSAAILSYFNGDKDKFSIFIDSQSVSPELIERISDLNNDAVDSNSWHSVISREFTKINEDFCVSISKYLKSFCHVFEEMDDNTKKLFPAATKHITSQVHQWNDQFQQIQETRRHETMKQWFHLWNRLSFDRALWEDARNEKASKHYKRNMFLCWNKYPSRLKLNYKFDDHRLASLVQETGNIAAAQRILDEEKQRLKQMDEDQYCASSFLMSFDSNSELNSMLSKSGSESILLSELRKVSEGSIVDSYQAVYYKLEKEKPIDFQIYSNKIILESQDSIILNASSILSILMRGILHQPRGLEIIMKNGPAYLIIFPKSQKNVFEILRLIASLKGFNNVLIQTTPHPKFFKTLGIKEKWESGHLSNFEYLLALNCYSGRSFNDPAMYPIFPWILSDYSSASLDLNNPDSYRDLSKPVGALNPERLEKLQKRKIPSDTIVSTPYLYPSCYSSLLYVYLFLIRMEPYTSLHIKTQSGKFDHGPRQFSSIKKAYDLVNENIQDFRELTPEFFFESSFLNNVNNFHIGKFEGNQIGDVELPPWAHKSSFEFIYLNRKALESPYVSQHLNEWIDLIWGVKQNGPKAVEANNTFIPYMYESIWSNELISAPGKSEGAEAILKTCGQIPTQLFFTEHEAKKEPEFPHLPTNPKETLSLTIENICYSCISSTSANKVQLIAVDIKGMIYTVTIKFIENQQPPYLIVEKQWKLSFREWNPNLITNLDSTTIAAGSSHGKIEIINETFSDPIYFRRHLGKITCLVADNLYFATGGTDTVTNVFISNKVKNNDPLIANNTLIPDIKFYHFFPTYRDDVTCCAVNSNFDLIVSGTRDSSLFFFSPINKTVTKIVDLNKRIPEKVLITDGWGFVVVYEIDMERGVEWQCIEVYDVNGEFIISKPLQFAIQQWTTYKSVDGFDYLLMISKSGIFFSCEVFYLDVIKAINDRIDMKVLSLSYSYDLGLIFICLCNGTIQMIQYRIASR